MSDTTIEDTFVESDGATSEVLRETPVDVTAEVISIEQHVDVESRSARGLVIRQMLERQLVAGQGLSTDLVDAVTDATVAVAHAPTEFVDEIRGGADLPTALARSGSTMRTTVVGVGGRVRSVVGGYVGSQATLPNAVVSGTADVAETVVRAQGTLVAAGVNAAFAVAAVAVNGGDVGATLTRERDGAQVTAEEARTRVGASVARAGDNIRSAIRNYDGVAAAFSE